MKGIILILVLFLAACDCRLKVGDRVARISDGKQGVVVSITKCRAPENCDVAVMHDDGTYSRDNYTLREYVSDRQYYKLD